MSPSENKVIIIIIIIIITFNDFLPPHSPTRR